MPENRHHDVLDHVTKIFLRDGSLVQCFPPCTTGQREREFRDYATLQLRSGCCVMALDGSTVVGACLNRLTPNDPYMGRTVPLTSKRCILYIYSINVGTEYFKRALYSPFFFSSKCSLFHNANSFGFCIIHILYTGCAKIKKIIPAPKG